MSFTRRCKYIPLTCTLLFIREKKWLQQQNQLVSDRTEYNDDISIVALMTAQYKIQDSRATSRLASRSVNTAFIYFLSEKKVHEISI